MRDVTTSVASFLILAVLATGIYLAVQRYQEAERAPALVALPNLDEAEDVLNVLLGTGGTPPPPPPVPTRSAPTPPGPTPTASPTAPPTEAPRRDVTTPAPPPTPAPLPTPTPASTITPTPRFPFVLGGAVRHDNACPGQYIMGVIRDAQGRPLSGITVWMEDEFGNRATQVSKSTAGEQGRYEFVLTGEPRRIYVWIVDEGGTPISPRVEILHLLPNSGYETFPCHYVDWQRTTQ